MTTKTYNTPDIFLNNNGYVVKRELGRGMFGCVYEATDARGAVYAIKKVSTARMAHPSARGWETAQDELRIARVLEKYPAPHVVRVYKTLEDPGSGAYYIVMERLVGNTLRDLIERQYRAGLLDEWLLKNCVLSIVEGVRELEARFVVHRDIKPENVFVCDRGTWTEVKLIDFGLGRYVAGGGEELMHSVVGTPLYMAPEMDERRAYTWECDVWSAGMCAYFAATGRDLVAVNPQTYKEEKKAVQAGCREWRRSDYRLAGIAPGSGAERVLKKLLGGCAKCSDILKDEWFSGCTRVRDYNVPSANEVKNVFVPYYNVPVIIPQQQQQNISYCGYNSNNVSVQPSCNCYQTIHPQPFLCQAYLLPSYM